MSSLVVSLIIPTFIRLIFFLQGLDLGRFHLLLHDVGGLSVHHSVGCQHSVQSGEHLANIYAVFRTGEP